MPVVALSSTFLATGLVVPEGKQRIEYCDSACPGLLVEVRATVVSVPTYYLRYKRAGKTGYDRLGSIKELSLTQARKIASQKKVEHAPFAKVAPEQKTAPGEMTLDTFWCDHFLPQCKLHLRSWARSEGLYRLWLKEKFGHCTLSSLTRSQFLQYQAELANTDLSPASQDHVIKLARRLLNYAVELELLERNPLKGIKLRLVNNELHDVPGSAPMEKLLEVLRTDTNRPVCNMILFLLSTAARLGEVRKATISQFDMANKIWTIPAANAKSKVGRSVPLNQSAMLALAEAEKYRTSEYVFGNPKTGKPFVTITRVWYRLRSQAGVKMRLHSCRHYAADRLLSVSSLYHVQVALGHADPRVSQRYAKLKIEDLRSAMESASLFSNTPTPPAAPAGQEAGAEAVETAKVLPFPRAA